MKLDLRTQVMQAADEKLIYIGRNLLCNGNNFFDTGFAPFSNENINKDFKITIRLKAFTPSENQAVILGAKYEGTIGGQQWPGIYFRQQNTGSTLEIGGSSYIRNNASVLLNKNIYIWRKSNTFYMQIDGGTSSTFQVRSTQFNQSIVIGAGVQTNGTKFRYSKCTIDYIRIEVI